jgi:16S rRNA (adenine1518-N6/adenine1519-N6)-dimethyltransferase
VARARKRFGQHFLEPAWVTKLVAAIDPQPADLFLEIGPGRGAITVPLAATVRHLLAIEIDWDLAAALQARALPNVTVVTADVLDVDLAEQARQLQETAATASPVRVAGNLPYNISSPILFRLLEASSSGRLRDATLLLQREVADRLTAAVGTSEYGPLTLCTMLGATVTPLLALPPGAFRPPPKVRSAVVRLDFRPSPAAGANRQVLIDLVRSVFTQRRKTMGNALAGYASSRGRSAHELLRTAGIDPKRRPETLDLLEFARLAELVAVL